MCDSWFSYPAQIRKLSEHLPMVCMLKNVPATAFLPAGRVNRLNGLYQKVKRIKRKDAFKGSPIIVSITVDMLNGPKVHVVFVRDQGDPEKWLAIAGTNLTLSRQISIYFALFIHPAKTYLTSHCPPPRKESNSKKTWLKLKI